MSFSNWYHNKLNEEQVDMTSSLDDEAPVQQQQMPADKAAAPKEVAGHAGIIAPYTNGTSLKLGFKKLGEDIGMAIVEYATKQAVQVTDFKSEDDYIKYCRDIRINIAEKSNIAMRDMLTDIGLYIDNKMHNMTTTK